MQGKLGLVIRLGSAFIGKLSLGETEACYTKLCNVMRLSTGHRWRTAYTFLTVILHNGIKHEKWHIEGKFTIEIYTTHA